MVIVTIPNRNLHKVVDMRKWCLDNVGKNDKDWFLQSVETTELDLFGNYLKSVKTLFSFNKEAVATMFIMKFQ